MYQFTEGQTKRKFSVEVFESKPYLKCLAKVDEEGDIHIMEQYKDGSTFEIYGIIYSHFVDVSEPKIQTAAESFRNRINEILHL